nr:hypothetical protein Iba_chr07bCG2690 [Ipomoea batatas]
MLRSVSSEQRFISAAAAKHNNLTVTEHPDSLVSAALTVIVNNSFHRPRAFSTKGTKHKASRRGRNRRPRQPLSLLGLVSSRAPKASQKNDLRLHLHDQFSVNFSKLQIGKPVCWPEDDHGNAERNSRTHSELHTSSGTVFLRPPR